MLKQFRRLTSLACALCLAEAIGAARSDREALLQDVRINGPRSVLVESDDWGSDRHIRATDRTLGQDDLRLHKMESEKRQQETAGEADAVEGDPRQTKSRVANNKAANEDKAAKAAQEKKAAQAEDKAAKKREKPAANSAKPIGKDAIPTRKPPVKVNDTAAASDSGDTSACCINKGQLDCCIVKPLKKDPQNGGSKWCPDKTGKEAPPCDKAKDGEVCYGDGKTCGTSGNLDNCRGLRDIYVKQCPQVRPLEKRCCLFEGDMDCCTVEELKADDQRCHGKLPSCLDAKDKQACAGASTCGLPGGKRRACMLKSCPHLRSDSCQAGLSRNWQGVTTVGKQILAYEGRTLWNSKDKGRTFQKVVSDNEVRDELPWTPYKVSASADGKTLAAADFANNIWVSQNGGITWTLSLNTTKPTPVETAKDNSTSNDTDVDSDDAPGETNDTATASGKASLLQRTGTGWTPGGTCNKSNPNETLGGQAQYNFAPVFAKNTGPSTLKADLKGKKLSTYASATDQALICYAAIEGTKECKDQNYTAVVIEGDDCSCAWNVVGKADRKGVVSTPKCFFETKKPNGGGGAGADGNNQDDDGKDGDDTDGDTDEDATTARDLEWRDGRYYRGVEVSADGGSMIAFTHNMGYMWHTHDGGDRWKRVTQTGRQYWSSVAMSPDAQHVVASEMLHGQVWVSHDAGRNWTGFLLPIDIRESKVVSDVAISDSGAVVAAVVNFGGFVWVSRDGGAHFAERRLGGIRENLIDVAISNNGSQIQAVAMGASPAVAWKSLDYGETWTNDTVATLTEEAEDASTATTTSSGSSATGAASDSKEGPDVDSNWMDFQGLSVDTDGSVMAAVTSPGKLYRSENGGRTWKSDTCLSAPPPKCMSRSPKECDQAPGCAYNPATFLCQEGNNCNGRFPKDCKYPCFWDAEVMTCKDPNNCYKKPKRACDKYCIWDDGKCTCRGKLPSDDCAANNEERCGAPCYWNTKPQVCSADPICNKNATGPADCDVPCVWDTAAGGACVPPPKCFGGSKKACEKSWECVWSKGQHKCHHRPRCCAPNRCCYLEPVDPEATGCTGCKDKNMTELMALPKCHETCSDGQLCRIDEQIQPPPLCNVDAGRKTCQGLPIYIQRANHDCVVSRWSAFGECSPEFGSNRTQIRTRTVKEVPARDGKACPEDLSQEAECEPNPPPVDCKWDVWTPEGPCALWRKNAVDPEPAPCDNHGWQKWTRKKAVEAAYKGKPCEGESEIMTKCQSRHCGIDCRFGNWSGWSTCSKRCGGGVQDRVRQVVLQAERGGAPCDGGHREQRQCNAQVCSTNCRYKEWSKWSDCTKTCGGGQQTRTRVLNATHPKLNPRFPQMNCEKGLEENRVCNTDACKVDCKWQDWYDWGGCSVSCGSGGKRHRTRNAMQDEFNGGKACTGDHREEQECKDLPACPTPCEHSKWGYNDKVGEWSKCSTTCGVGVKLQTRKVSKGAVCPGPLQRAVPCKMKECPVDCKIDFKASEWGPCSATCGVRTQTRKILILREPEFGGLRCPTKTARYCPKVDCPVPCAWGLWAPWSACSKSCGGGQKSRSRVLSGGDDCKAV
jgi:hypothetical protein